MTASIDLTRDLFLPIYIYIYFSIVFYIENTFAKIPYPISYAPLKYIGFSFSIYSLDIFSMAFRLYSHEKSAFSSFYKSS